MKSLRFVLSVVLISTVVFAQSGAQKPVAQSDAQKSFDKLKTLAGSWQGAVTATPAQRDEFRQTMRRLWGIDEFGRDLDAP